MNEPKTSAEHLESLDKSLTTIKRIALWFFFISLLGVLLGLFALLNR